jgi:hypothetical protein
MTDSEVHQPTDILAERLTRMGGMNQMQRVLYCFITERSSRGLWTTYEDCRDADIRFPKEPLSALCRISKAGIVKRKVGRVLEFCV